MKPKNSNMNINSNGLLKIQQSLLQLMAKFFRQMNLLNPTSHGRHHVTELAKRFRIMPTDGIFHVAPGVTMRLQMKDYIERSIYFDSFEFTCRRVLMSFLKSGYVFVDIGANVGYYSLLANKRVGDSGRVLSFEANPVTAKKMRENMQLSGAEQVELFEIALSDKDTEVQIFCPKDETHGFASMRNQGWREADSYFVPSKRLDDILPEGLTRLDLIKIDVEGAELLVFSGSAETIKKYKPAILLELNKEAAENFGYDTLEIVKLLISYNQSYRIKFIDTNSVFPITLDALFSHSLRNGNLILY